MSRWTVRSETSRRSARARAESRPWAWRRSRIDSRRSARIVPQYSAKTMTLDVMVRGPTVGDHATRSTGRRMRPMTTPTADRPRDPPRVRHPDLDRRASCRGRTSTDGWPRRPSTGWRRPGPGGVPRVRPRRRAVAGRRPVRRRQPGDPLGARPRRQPAGQRPSRWRLGRRRSSRARPSCSSTACARPVAERLAAMAKAKYPQYGMTPSVRRSGPDRHPPATGLRLDVVPGGRDPLHVR